MASFQTRPIAGGKPDQMSPIRAADPKTDVSDATWLAQLGAHGLLRASFVPPRPIRGLRDLTRTRSAITRERAREAQRLEKVL